LGLYLSRFQSEGETHNRFQTSDESSNPQHFGRETYSILTLQTRKVQYQFLNNLPLGTLFAQSLCGIWWVPTEDLDFPHRKDIQTGKTSLQVR
jgi:hypothetical protein